MNYANNCWFIIVTVLLLKFIGTCVTERVVEPRLGEYKGEYREKLEKITKIEKKGMVWAAIALVVAIILVALLILPEGAQMRGEDGGIIHRSDDITSELQSCGNLDCHLLLVE